MSRIHRKISKACAALLALSLMAPSVQAASVIAAQPVPTAVPQMNFVSAAVLATPIGAPVILGTSLPGMELAAERLSLPTVFPTANIPSYALTSVQQQRISRQAVFGTRATVSSAQAVLSEAQTPLPAAKAGTVFQNLQKSMKTFVPEEYRASPADFLYGGRIFDGSRMRAEETQAEPVQTVAPQAEQKPAVTAKQELQFALGIQQKLFQVVMNVLYQNGYFSPSVDPSKRAERLDAGFAMVINMAKQKLADKAPNKESFEAAIEVFSQLRRAAVEDAKARPAITVDNDYVFAAVFTEIVGKGKKSSSLAELKDIAKAAADRVQDPMFVQDAYYDVALTIVQSYLKSAQKELYPDNNVTTVEQVAAIFEAGLKKLQAEERASAPSEEAFQGVAVIAQAWARMTRALAAAKGMDLSLFDRVMETASIQSWFAQAQKVRSVEQARALAAEMDAVLAAAVPLVPKLWTRSVISRLMQETDQVVAARGLTETPEPLAYAGIVAEAGRALDAKKDQAPAQEAFEAAKLVADALIGIIGSLAALPNMTIELLQMGLSSQAVAQWMQKVQALESNVVDEGFRAEMLAGEADEVVNAVTAALPTLWAQGGLQRFEASLSALIEERGIEIPTLTPEKYMELAKEAQTGLSAAGAPTPEAADAAAFLVAQYLRIMGAIAGRASNFQEMAQNAGTIIQMAFLPAVMQAQTIKALKEAATQAANFIVSQLQSVEIDENQPPQG
ncbi:MAG: hypothetical protein WCU88_06625 [Elusimicrobiota bacterium]|jgi:hypothetical protein